MRGELKIMGIPQYPPQTNETETIQSSPRSSSSFSIGDALIFAAFTIIITGLVFNWISDYDQPPVEDDFSDYGDPYEAYQTAIEDHASKIQSFAGISSLFSSIGVVLLVAGLFSKTTKGSEHLPDWVRVVMMAGTLYFMVRLFTSELSLIDMITITQFL